MIKVTAQIIRKGDARKRVGQLQKAFGQPTKVKVGFPAGKSPGDLISIAFWNHEGTNRRKGDVFFRNGKVGISGPIPPRPFITMAMFKHRGELKTFLRAEAKLVLGGREPMARALNKLGMAGQQYIQQQITSNMGPPNSPMTVYLKGSTGTLRDTGRMAGSVTWEIAK